MKSVEELPLIVRAWLQQLLDDDVIDLVNRLETDHQIEVRLYSNAGRVRKKPTLILDGGPQEMSMVPPIRGAFKDEVFEDAATLVATGG